MEGPQDAFEFESAVDNAVLSYANRKFELRVAYLETFMHLELASCDRRKLRKCLAPDCATPYFVARHLGQRYCDEKCAKWAQSKWKKEWWAVHGNKWRKEHSNS
jgi:hypothetical protein